MEMSDSELKNLIINQICEELDLDNIYEVEFYTWLIWALKGVQLLKSKAKNESKRKHGETKA